MFLPIRLEDGYTHIFANLVVDREFALIRLEYLGSVMKGILAILVTAMSGKW